MLVLTRKKGERIRIGNDIEIVITDVQGDQVRIGIDAPKNIKVYRQEVYDAIDRANRDALTSVKDMKEKLKKIKNNNANT